MMRTLASLPEQSEPDVTNIAMLARVSVALASLPAVALLSNQTTWQARLTALQTQTTQVPALALLTQIAAQKDGPTLLDSMAETIADRVHGAKVQAKSNTKNDATKDGQIHALPIPAAGLALLLPALIHLSAKTPLTDAHRHAIALAALPKEQRREATLNAGFLHLFPRDPQTPEPADWPLPSLTGLPDHLLTAREGPDLWAQAAMAYFAERLPGLSGSSAGYLQDRFLCRSGDLSITETELTIALHRVPLGIVLSMGGHLGHRGRIPWFNNRALSITIKGGV
jgi:hypothetical protein